MKLAGLRSLDAYLAAADRIHAEVLDTYPEWLEVLREADVFWRNQAFGGAMEWAPISASLHIQSYFFWLAALRMALSGHGAAVQPILRMGLESSCFAVRIAEEPGLSCLWLSRNPDADHGAKFQERLDIAIADVCTGLAGDPELAGAVRALRDKTTALRGHPDPLVLLRELELCVQIDGQVLSCGALNHVESLDCIHSLIAVAEFGCLAIGLCATAARHQPRARNLEGVVAAMRRRIRELAAPYSVLRRA